MTIRTISTPQLLSALGNPGLAIVDIRPSAAYHGWKLHDEPRGGHIPGAVSFPHEWINRFSHSQLSALLMSKGLSSKQAVVVYGDHPDRTAGFADWLSDQGFRNILLYPPGQPAWAADASLPLECLPNYKYLVHPQWIQQLQSGQNPEHAPDQNDAVFEVGLGGIEDYRAGHIPGALPLDLSRLEDPHTWNILPDDGLLAVLADLGITRNSSAILYGRDIMAAARAAWILMYAGVEDVRILDGGLESWLRAGYPLESRVNEPLPAKFFGRATPGRPEYIAGIETVKAMLAHKDGLLVSVRSWAEYTGETSGYDFIQPSGRIPGALWGHSGADPHHMQDFRNPDDTMRATPEIAVQWERAGITGGNRVVFYCGTGWRASEAFFYAHLMGWPQIAVYDGGWYEWSRDRTNPIESGAPTPYKKS